ncbi:hypothetical protein GCM10027590_14340 [Nocardiopsis nanhaiensis]
MDRCPGCREEVSHENDCLAQEHLLRRRSQLRAGTQGAAGADVRDTQNREAGHLSFASQEWAALLDEVRSLTR